MARKIFIYQIIFFISFFAQVAFSHPVDDVLNANSKFASAVVGISVKDANSGAVIYQKNPKTLVHPASSLKLITSAAALDYLGDTYKFKTTLYKNANKTYLKVGADPLFTYDDMVKLVSMYAIKNTEPVKSLVIDDSVIDKDSYGIGWQWDDNASTFFPQISPYIINRNLFMVKAKCEGSKVSVRYAQEYSEKIINQLDCAKNTNVSVSRNIFANELKVVLSGGIRGEEIIYIPALAPERLYQNVLIYGFLANSIVLNTTFSFDKIPVLISKEAEVEHDIKDVIYQILANSDNLAAEVLLKHAGAAFVNGTGTTKSGLQVVKNFYQHYGVNTDDIILVDASGTSMNDYVTADFMTNALVAIKRMPSFDTIWSSMADTKQGTFKGRVSDLSGRIKAKTGTLANTDTVVGYIQTNSGRNLVFAIMLDNIPKGVNPKELQNQIINALARQ